MIIMKKNLFIIIIILFVVFTISLIAVSIMPVVIVNVDMRWGSYADRKDIINVIIFLSLFNIFLIIFLVILLSIILYLLRESERTSKSVNAQ